MKLKKAFSRLTGNDKHPGHGPWDEANDGWVDPKPYIGHFRNGIFEGYDGSVWKYFEVPEDVQIDWLTQPGEAIMNQHFFVDVAKDFGAILDQQQEKTRGDVRRNFHIQITQTPSEKIQPYPGCKGAHLDYLERFSSAFTKPIWHGFVGIQILPTTVFYEAHGFQAKLQRYLEVLRDPGALEWTYFAQDLDEVDSIMTSHGFRTLDFVEHPETFEQITAWHGIADEAHGLPRQLQATRMKEPVHAMSIITPKWDEVTFHALRPQERSNIRDPLTEDSRWAVPLYNPGMNVVLINIRGEIRAPGVADNLLDMKKTQRTGKRGSDASDRHTLSQIELIESAREVVNDVKLPMLDNTEIIIGSKVDPRGRANPIPQVMRGYGLEAVPLLGRQQTAILSSMPTYPRHVMRVPRGNRKRPDLTNVMLPGVLAFSGIFRATKPCGPGGVLMGLSDAGDQFNEIYTETDGAYKNSRVPGMLVTGRPGAGKTQQLLQMTNQMAYMELPVVFFNPKKEGTLKPTFDHIGGVTISMNRQYLEQNPGLLDPVFFLGDRREVARVIADAIFMANHMYDEAGSESSQRRTQVQTEIQDRALDARNTCSYQILFGNNHPDPEHRTEPISDTEVLNFVYNRMRISPFWQAFISTSQTQSELQRRMEVRRSILIEWDKSMQLPAAEKLSSDYTDPEIDMVLSINTTFMYASAYVGGSGGAIIVDESWVLKSSREARAILTRGGREWRQANIMLILGTQNITDWLDAGQAGSNEAAMDSFFDRYLFMAINEANDRELDAFFKLTKLPRTEANADYIRYAGVDKRRSGGGNRIPRAYYVDRVHNWAGGVICGPWPKLELDLGRTDKEGEEARRTTTEAEEAAGAGMISGSLLDVLADSRELAAELSGGQLVEEPV